VIVHSAYKDLIAEYHKLYFPRIPLIVKTVDVHNGSAHAILSSCSHLEGKSVFFQWCDVMPGELFEAQEMTEHYLGANVVFTNYDHPNRYGLVRTGTGWADVKPALQEDGRGGVFGLYYISQFKTDIEFKDGQDFVEVLTQFGPIRERKLNSIVDWGDMPKLERTRETADAAREFNKVEFNGDLVLKSAINAQGETLIKREIEWYRTLNREGMNPPRMPKTWIADDNKSFVMSKVDGVPVFQLWPSLDNEGRALVLGRMVEQMQILHGNKGLAPFDQLLNFHQDLQIEACEKLISRYREIKGVIDAFGYVRTVNGFTLREHDPEVTIRRLYARLVDTYAAGAEYSVIHGDLQMSNTMINPDTLEVSIIDPRGYFGKTQVNGLPDYDIAKLLYSLSGYDLFNYSHTFHLKTEPSMDAGHILTFEIPRPDLGGCEEIMNSVFWEQHYVWLAIIWIGLAQYIKNDPVKSIAAHYHGLAMGEQVLAGINDRFRP
jgi:aminoglycoside phosphotransferase